MKHKEFPIQTRERNYAYITSHQMQ